ncbi:prepilin-type N-terminal cleavage/methylation domain-containing protein [Jatrophihabitans cynanchi]|jgi:type IV pilus assembly protein PilA|uniref:prepilin-type N-terminal cleavage/methylation domain-containing protein n=1 Tax=Jatrophihabitans cynanchi TaxID=2944128 RepID=UPI0022B22A5D|nr:prepilin-type N-terminal cleavage/methylation domain-containing protein [Jatrophihabitans sp. SB3-54]
MFNRLAKLREERAQGEKGFTLIELLVVVVIIGILIAIAIPLYLNYQKGAKNKSAESDVRNAVSTVEQCISDGGSVPAAAAVTGSGTKGADLVFTCGASGTQTAKVGSDNTLTYTPGTDTYKLVAASSGGGKSYCYNSSVGGSVKEGTTC